MVGVEHSVSETARRTSKGRKIWRMVHLRRSKGEARRVVFSCKGVERGEWQGPKGRADALAIVVLWRKENRAARPVGPTSPFLVASDQKCQILALVVSPYGVSKGINTSHGRRLSSFEP